MVTGAHHNAHLISQTGRFRVVLVEVGAPHGRPEIVGFQAKQQFKYFLIGLGVDATEMLGTPCAKARPFVVDEDAAILYGRPFVDKSLVVVQFVLMYYGSICHPIPG